MSKITKAFGVTEKPKPLVPIDFQFKLTDGTWKKVINEDLRFVKRVSSLGKDESGSEIFSVYYANKSYTVIFKGILNDGVWVDKDNVI